MVISPDRDDFCTIANLVGRLILGLAGFLVLPMCVALYRHEMSPLCDFSAAFLITVFVGQILVIVFPARRELTWMHSFFAISIGWMAYAVLGAIPLWLARQHFSSFLDAWFEVTSGLATTGFTLCQDLDHLSFSHNVWRHFTMFIGGQGIIIAGLSLLRRAKSVAVGLYVGEARSEKILPNVIDTARFIWKVSFVYLAAGITTISAVLMWKGVVIERAVYHAFCLFCAAFDTGGFGPQTLNIGYYHSFGLEMVVVVCMILGGISFNLHYWMWTRQKKEMYKDLETRTFAVTFFSALALCYWGMKGASSMYLFRKGFFHMISAHSGCGFATINPYNEMSSWPAASLLALIFAMSIGMGACSTTGGIKLMRVGLMFKTLAMEMKRLMMPLRARHKERFRHLQDMIVSDERIKDAFLIFTIYIVIYGLGGVVGVLYGYAPLAALFESVSATANVGLSAGIVSSGMPAGLKVMYALQMWLGRLEFLTVFVSLGFIISLFRK